MAKINEFQKWPTDKPRYDKNYLRLYGKPCLKCKGTGLQYEPLSYEENGKDIPECPDCNGVGYVWKAIKGGDNVEL